MYKVTLNWHTELHTFKTEKRTPLSALQAACYALSKKLGKKDKDNIYYHYRYGNGHYEVKEI
jgi:hypothetical protein